MTLPFLSIRLARHLPQNYMTKFRTFSKPSSIKSIKRLAGRGGEQAFAEIFGKRLFSSRSLPQRMGPNSIHEDRRNRYP
jgi:hypothetical protein